MIEKACFGIKFFIEYTESLEGGANIRTQCCKALMFRRVSVGSTILRPSKPAHLLTCSPVQSSPLPSSTNSFTSRGTPGSKVEELIVIFSGRVAEVDVGGRVIVGAVAKPSTEIQAAKIEG